ncbi:SMP-30/gluconolactonase/LRE family protein [Pulveribacter sp.]|uniref:SMP-30/gluconolactonase/LRE family protein n=1 Tax=Pulveribacter sp. TaxID=2678893 RepID=UPI0028AD10DB|nr:SMP-30/gluconolactonase/LRE family protein [Pulveribacter sp.]
MFSAPPILRAEQIATLPVHLRRQGQTAPWLQVQQRGRPAHSFIEGPAFDEAGRLLFTDIPYGRIFRMQAGGQVELVFEYDGEPNGLKSLAPGRWLIADHKHGILLLDLEQGRVTPHCDRPLLERFKGVNDLYLAADGTLYFTDQGQTGLHDPTGRVYQLSPDGRLQCLLDNVPSPNGVVLEASGEALLVAATRANQVWRLPLLLGGGVSKVGAFINLSGGVGPDGLAIGPDGCIAVCHPGLASVWIFSRHGEPLWRVVSPVGRMTTNCVFGGPDGRTLYITESDTASIVSATLPVHTGP